MTEPFKGVIKLDVRDSVPDWTPYELKQAPEGAPNVLVILYDDTGMAAWSPYGGRINMPTLDRLADNGLTYTQWHTTALCSPDQVDVPDRTQPPCQSVRVDHRGVAAASRAPRAACPPSARPSDRCCRTTATAPTGSARTTTCRSRTSRRAAAARSGRCRKDSTASTGSSAVRPTSGIPTSSTTTTSSNRPTPRKTATTCPKTLPTKRSRCCATSSRRHHPSRGSCGSAPAPTTHRTTPRRSTSTSTKASSTTATRPTASGCSSG